MARRNDAAAQAAASAANAASEAARTLQQRSQEVRQEQRAEPPVGDTPPRRPPTKAEAPAEGRNVEKMRANRPHQQAMDDLLERRGLNTPPEGKEEEKPAPKAEEKPAEKPAAKPEEKPAEKPAEQPAAEVAVAEAPKTVKQKVDGEEYDVPQAEIDEAGGEKAWRLNKAQENRLRKINEANNESKAREERMMKLAETLLQQNAPKPQPQVSNEQFIAGLLQKIRFGSDEEGAQALIEATQRLNQPVDANQLTARIASNLKYDQAEAQFRQEFQDIAANPLLLRLAKQLEGERVAQHVKNGQPDWQALSTLDWGLLKRTIGNEVRSAVGRQSQPAPQGDKTAGNPSPASAKEERKASIVNLPSAAARAEAPKEEKEPTPEEARSQWFAETKKKRGQV